MKKKEEEEEEEGAKKRRSGDMPSYPISQFTELEDVMCKVNKSMGARGQPLVERVKFGSGAKVGDANELTSVSSGEEGGC